MRISDWSSDVCSYDLQPCAAKIPPAVSEAEDFRTRSDRFVGSSTLLFRPVGRPTFLCLPKENVGKRKGTLAFAPLLRSGFLRCSTRRPQLKDRKSVV